MVKKLGIVVVLFCTFTINASKLPVDITFLAIDLKFDNGNVKVLEFQDGPQAGLRAYDYVFGKGGVWKAFWQELFALKVPVFYVGPQPHKSTKNFSHNDAVHIAFDDFIKNGGMFFKSLKSLQESPVFSHALKLKKDSTSLFPAHGLVLYKIDDDGTPPLRSFAYAHPQAVIINRYMRTHSFTKLRTHRLWCDAGLEKLRPRTKIYPKKYHTTLASNIENDLGGNLFVIKPLNSSRSNGVIMVTAADLDKTLKRILTISGSRYQSMVGHTYRPDSTLTYDYWKLDPNDQFIVEAYAPSQKLVVNDKEYDPSMRAIWMMTSNGSNVTIKRLAAFWKIPAVSLDATATLTEKHVSKFRNDLTSLNPHDLQVSDTDLATLDAVMNPSLEKIYTYALKYPAW